MNRLLLAGTLALLACSTAQADTPPTYYGRWGAMGSDNGQFATPRGIGVNPWGDVYVADYNNQRVQRFTALGAFDTAWGSFGSDTSQFIGPWDIAISKTGNVYVAEGAQRRSRPPPRTSPEVSLAWGRPMADAHDQYVELILVAKCHQIRTSRTVTSMIG